MSTAKRPAPRTPEKNPAKRRATSSPEEGEVDDGYDTGTWQPGPSTSTADTPQRAREAISYARRRPGAPHYRPSPPSLHGSAEKTSPAPPPVLSTPTTAPAKAPANGVVKSKRVPVKRTREEEKAVYHRVFLGCGQRDDYDIVTKLGEGTFGEVHKALHKHTREAVALKRILMHNEKEGMPVTALREIKILKALKHPCIVDLLDMFVIPGKGKDVPMSVYMVFPYMDHDLAGLLENERVKLSPSQIKLYMKQLLEGTEYMHHNHILHRDMKAANLLISNNGSLKIADFGLARAFDPSGTTPGTSSGRDRRYTNCVVTRWYRPPELLLGARQYGGEIDIWGIGCVLGEMFMRRPILPGNTDLDQLDKIWSICGSPNQQNWPDYDKLPGCDGQIRFKPQERRIKQVYESIGKETCALLDRLLTLDPRERITASDALDHEYFWSDPLPADPKSLPTYEPSHEFDQRGRRHQPPAQNDVQKPAVRHGLPPPLHNRNFRNEGPHKQSFRPDGPPPYPPHNVANNSFNRNSYRPALSQHPLPSPPSQNPWTSAPPPPHNSRPWGPNRPSNQGGRFGNGPMGLVGGGWGEPNYQASQLPPRPAGLPPRPDAPPQPTWNRDTSFQNSSFGGKIAPGLRGRPPGGGSGLNYG
ncbi:Pkinase-domain-containing protein [Fomitiporia mediterranea MF3/22]|uniref:Pkinase-domain-containing protein n=1 Tax=Fomitiporia mediterranea (strain MF3/22) TaxID=694068 RepID=UPI0004407F8A|nr:Pkinase-domain-containing protein [Fomitiporia mediterranea MF3/22]EJD05345.1 Pkinase-domain-containing protein [Fomitiporia mediterranea MF3/22]